VIRVLIVDDEPPARAKVRKLLAAEDDFEVVAEAADGEEAVAAIRDAAIREQAPDVVFLDVQMPRLDGFGVVAEVGVEEMPRVVFVTAFDEHALRAFEVHAFDYLLKPFAPSRFRRVLARVREQLAKDSAADLARRLEELLDDAGGGVGSGGGTRPLRRILLRRGQEREILLPVEEVDRVCADGNYLRFHTRRGELTRRGTLTDLEARLDPDHFLRINRSEIVRLDAVREFQPWFHGDYRAILEDGTVLTWSRRYRARWKEGF